MQSDAYFLKDKHRRRKLRNLNRPFPSSKTSHFQSEAKCEAIDMKIIFNYDANKTPFQNKGFALSLVLKVRFLELGNGLLILLLEIMHCARNLQISQVSDNR